MLQGASVHLLDTAATPVMEYTLTMFGCSIDMFFWVWWFDGTTLMVVAWMER